MMQNIFDDPISRQATILRFLYELYISKGFGWRLNVTVKKFLKFFKKIKAVLNLGQVSKN